MAARLRLIRANSHRQVVRVGHGRMIGSWPILDQPQVERAVRRQPLDLRPNRPCAEVDVDVPAGVHRLAGQAAKRDKGHYQMRPGACRKAGYILVERIHQRDRVSHACIRRIAYGLVRG